MDEKVYKLGIIGCPLSHSLSKFMHEAALKDLGLNGSYDTLETKSEDLIQRIKFLKTNGYLGFNVTIPHKIPISLFLSDVDEFANKVGSVNTVVIDENKNLKGYNTDVLGFKKAIPSDIVLTGKRAAILGTGGASRAAAIGLIDLGVKGIDFYTRNIPNSMDLLNYMRRLFPNVNFETHQIERVRDLSMFDMVVNTTPIGMLGRSADMMPLESAAIQTIPKHAVVYDVIYNPKKTLLLKESEKSGLRTINGLDMLIYQAVSAQEIWFGRTPDFSEMKIAALEALS